MTEVETPKIPDTNPPPEPSPPPSPSKKGEILRKLSGFIRTTWDAIGGLKGFMIALAGIFMVVAVLVAANKFLIEGNGVSIEDAIDQWKREIQIANENIDKLNQVVETERAAREELERSFNARITEIQAHYDEELERIRTTRAVRQREIMSRPTEISSRFNERFGLSSTSERVTGP